jgi:hypothetical protein
VLLAQVRISHPFLTSAHLLVGLYAGSYDFKEPNRPEGKKWSSFGDSRRWSEMDHANINNGSNGVIDQFTPGRITVHARRSSRQSLGPRSLSSAFPLLTPATSRHHIHSTQKRSRPVCIPILFINLCPPCQQQSV